MQNIVILISGRGSNLQALLEARLPGRVAAVISSRADASGLSIAHRHGIAATTIAHTAHASREQFDAVLALEIERHQPDLVVLAGFMRILSDDFVRRFEGRLMNIHPSLLPAFPGMHTHRQALAAGVKLHGCTVHFVTPALDGGPIVIQSAVPVYPDDTEQHLAERVLAEEHVIYPQAVRWFLEGRLRLNAAGRVVLDGEQRKSTAMRAPTLDVARA